MYAAPFFCCITLKGSLTYSWADVQCRWHREMCKPWGLPRIFLSSGQINGVSVPHPCPALTQTGQRCESSGTLESVAKITWDHKQPFAKVTFWLLTADCSHCMSSITWCLLGLNWIILMLLPYSDWSFCCCAFLMLMNEVFLQLWNPSICMRWPVQ